MRKALIAGIVAVGLLAGCNMTHLEGPPAAMSIKGADTTLIGQYSFPSVKPKGGRKVEVTANLSVSDGVLSCSGQSTYMEKAVTQVQMPISCSDGNSGNAILVLNPDSWRNSMTGIGQGKLTNGRKFKIIVGPLNGTLDW